MGQNHIMPDLSSVLKQEISRIARKELRGETGSTKKAIAAYRSQIAEMKRRLQQLERQVAQLRKQDSRHVAAAAEDGATSLRFRSEGFAKHRQRLGLSAKDMGLLIGASGLSVYKWEQGKARPRAKHLEAIAAVRKIGKREALSRLETLSASG
jgi:DNA-binding transcriptional regulator YiaG